jgi:hypothetical protein
MTEGRFQSPIAIIALASTSTLRQNLRFSVVSGSPPYAA